MSPEELRAEALRGPWVATLTEPDGFVLDLDLDDMEAHDYHDYLEISVVRGTATPTVRDGGMRLPGTCDPADVLYRVDDFEDKDDVLRCWERAQAVAEALNALGVSR